MKITSTEEIIERIKEEETSDKHHNLRWLDSHSLIQTTKEVGDCQLKKLNISQTSIEINRNLKIDLALWILFFLLTVIPMGYITTKELQSVKGSMTGIIIGISFIFLFFFAAYKNLKLKRLTLPIVLTEKHITIIGDTYLWDEIENTFLVSRPTGKIVKSFFVIGLKNGQIKYYDIRNQLGFKYDEFDFSLLVEHFKSKHFAQHSVLRQRGATQSVGHHL